MKRDDLDELVPGKLQAEDAGLIFDWLIDKMNEAQTFTVAIAIKIEKGGLIQALGGDQPTVSLLLDMLQVRHNQRIQKLVDKGKDFSPDKPPSWDDIANWARRN